VTVGTRAGTPLKRRWNRVSRVPRGTPDPPRPCLLRHQAQRGGQRVQPGRHRRQPLLELRSGGVADDPPVNALRRRQERALLSADRGAATSPTPSRWTAASPAPPGPGRQPGTRWSRCSRWTGCGYHPQGRQGGDHPAGAAERPGHRPGHRRPYRRAAIPGQGRPAAGPARRRADRPHDCPPCRDRQSRHAAYAAAGIHHRRAGTQGCRGGTCRKPPRTPIRGRRCGTTGPAAAWTGTPPTSSPLTSPGPPG